MRLDSKLVPGRDTFGGMARQVPSFCLYFFYYYHPCLNYSVAAISITPAMLYLAPSRIDCVNISLQISRQRPDKRREADATERN